MNFQFTQKPQCLQKPPPAARPVGRGDSAANRDRPAATRAVPAAAKPAAAARAKPVAAAAAKTTVVKSENKNTAVAVEKKEVKNSEVSSHRSIRWD